MVKKKMSKPLNAFITHSQEDKQKKKKLRMCLAVMERDGKLQLQDDDDITAGGKARQEDILREVADSDILLYLVSAASLASENCSKELTEAVRAERRVIPIILESCDWLGDRLSNFEVLPDKGNPINKWKPQSDGWQNVVDGIREAVKEMLSQAELAFQHGNMLIMIRQMDKAIECYSRAVRLNPNYAAAYSNRARAYRRKRDYGRAIEDFNKAINLNPNYAEAYCGRGVVYSNKRNYDRAIGDHTKAIALKHSYVNAYLNRGVAYRDKADYVCAIKDFTKANELDYDDARPYLNRGLARLCCEEWENAKSDLMIAKDKGVDIVASFCKTYESAENFERKNNVKIPEDIAAMLTQRQTES